MASSLWSSTPWSDAGPAWHKHRVPYKSQGTYLHTLDVWIPKKKQDRSSCPPSDFVPTQTGTWLVYIHGGAWRDPLVDSSSFQHTALQLLEADLDCGIAGIASLNYPLSKHVNHPTHPSPPRDPSQPIDDARTASHPDHIIAVLTALEFLQNGVGIAHEYVLSGHSCGATLTFQVVMSAERWAKAASDGVTVPQVRKPEVIVGLNGLYDLKRFIDNPPDSHRDLVPAYREFTTGAFGEDEKVWQTVCPTDVSDWAAEWPEGKIVVVVQSREDGLVPYSQTEMMKENLEKAAKLTVAEMDAGGDHNDMWKVGHELADIMTSVFSKYT